MTSRKIVIGQAHCLQMGRHVAFCRDRLLVDGDFKVNLQGIEVLESYLVGYFGHNIQKKFE